MNDYNFGKIRERARIRIKLRTTSLERSKQTRVNGVAFGVRDHDRRARAPFCRRPTRLPEKHKEIK